jgi:hypothetical protein
MTIDWNVDNIISELEKCYWATTDPRMDGFTTWRCKQDLYRVQFALEHMLKNCPKYAPEKEWLEQQQLERDQKQVWRTLSAKTSNK